MFSNQILKHLLTLDDLGAPGMARVLDRAADMKALPAAYADAMRGRVLLMIFAKPSLRTRISFETGMARMGGTSIHYNLMTSPLGAGKESYADSAQVFSRYVDVVMARLFAHADMEEIVAHSQVPVINGLTDFSHPCQSLADLLTMREKKGGLEGLRVCYLGDSNNNVTHSLMSACNLMGIELRIGCPDDPTYAPAPHVLEAAPTTVVHDAREAADEVDVIYTDTWMSYHIEAEEKEKRIAALQPFQVDASIMACAKPDAIFMNCLPAQRGYEQTAEVIDGPQSVVFDQAENRMWAQNSVLIDLLEPVA